MSRLQENENEEEYEDENEDENENEDEDEDEDDAFDWPGEPRHVETAAEMRAREGARALIELWMRANQLRQRAEAMLRAHSLSFPLWWVLYVTDELIRETSDAVSQRDVSRRTRIDKATVSYLMGVLAERGLVDRGPEFGGTSYRIWLTQEGETLLAQSSRSIELAVQAVGHSLSDSGG